MARRFLLVGLLSIFQPVGSVMQLVHANLICVIFLVIQVQAKPFRHKADNYVAVACSASLQICFLLCLLFKYSSFTDLPDVNERMSPEQRELYSPDALWITGMMIAAVLFTILTLSIVSTINVLVDDIYTKARRLRSVKTGLSVGAPIISDDGYHFFLSHVWGTGQDQMRIVKQRLLEMIPDLKVFLDVDDLEDISDLEGYIDRTEIVFIYCSQGYFQSKNCMRELISSTQKRKRMIACLDLDTTRGGMSRDEVQRQLLEAEERYAGWRFPDDCPTGTELFKALFKDDPLEWNRIGAFQDVTMRLIVERLLDGGRKRVGTMANLRQGKLAKKLDKTQRYKYFLQGEIIHKPVVLPPPNIARSHVYHVYCSKLNEGAAALIEEVSGILRLALHDCSRPYMTVQLSMAAARDRPTVHDRRP